MQKSWWFVKRCGEYLCEGRNTTQWASFTPCFTPFISRAYRWGSEYDLRANQDIVCIPDGREVVEISNEELMVARIHEE